MKKRMLIFWMSALAFVLSVCVGVYAVMQIVSSTWMTERALRQWEEKYTHAQRSGADIIRETEMPGGQADTENGNSGKPRPLIVYPEGEVIGKIVFPSLRQEMPIVEGTAMDDLARGVGHFKESVMPGGRGNAVLAGHRDGVFRQLGDVRIGDEVTVQTSEGTYVYKIESRKIVAENDRSVSLEKQEPVLTLVTCYPFSYVGPAPKRLILTASMQ